MKGWLRPARGYLTNSHCLAEVYPSLDHTMLHYVEFSSVQIIHYTATFSPTTFSSLHCARRAHTRYHTHMRPQLDANLGHCPRRPWHITEKTRNSCKFPTAKEDNHDTKSTHTHTHALCGQHTPRETTRVAWLCVCACNYTQPVHLKRRTVDRGVSETSAVHRSPVVGSTPIKCGPEHLGSRKQTCQDPSKYGPQHHERKRTKTPLKEKRGQHSLLVPLASYRIHLVWYPAALETCGSVSKRQTVKTVTHRHP